MTVFAEKLDQLLKTISAAAAVSEQPLAVAIAAGAGDTVLAIGSGGSAVVAEYFAACRASLGYPPTAVLTPLAYVADASTSLALPAWLFSASGSNPDIIAAYEHARSTGTAEIDLLTSARSSELAAAVAPVGRLHEAPVADPKDGFLATHSLVGAATRLLIAADVIGSGPSAEERRVDLEHAYRRRLSVAARTRLATELGAIGADEVLFVLHDPHLRAAALLIETSVWETGLLPVQMADFRNFAHGRHVWLTGRQRRARVVALVTDDTRRMWQATERELPIDLPRVVFDFGRPSRAGLFEALLVGLALVEAIGAELGVDPGKPGVAEFGRALYAMPSLREYAQLPTPVRRKQLAMQKLDPLDRNPIDWRVHVAGVIETLRAAEVRGLVLDYDGTMVTTEARLSPPDPRLVAELERLLAADFPLAFATGRGGSIGTMLRQVLPEKFHPRVTIGYYNGGYLAPLSIDIEKQPPEAHKGLQGFHHVLAAHGELFSAAVPRCSTMQISIPSGSLRNFEAGMQAIRKLIAQHAQGVVRLIRSGHSLDIVPFDSGKGTVISRLRAALPDGGDVLSIGDSGDAQGNDYELFTASIGLSVGKVCHRPNHGWNLGLVERGGPAELLRILASLYLVAPGQAKIDVDALVNPDRKLPS